MLQTTAQDTARLNQGIIVERAAATLPATATSAIYTVTGSVLVNLLYGVCTTVCSATATNLSIVHVAAANTTLANTLAIASFAQGTLVAAELDGTALVGATNQLAVAYNPKAAALLLTGSISLTTSATNTGAFRWVLRYVPIEAGSTIVAA